MNRTELNNAKAKLIAAGFTYVCATMADTKDSNRFGLVFSRKDYGRFYLNLNTIGDVDGVCNYSMGE